MTRQAVAKGRSWSSGRKDAWGGVRAGGACHPTANLARELKTYLVVGHSEPAQPKSFNAAAIVGPDGRVRGIHRKIHLFLCYCTVDSRAA